MFIGRKREQAELERLYETGVYQFVIMYGRRRIGKTRLLDQFTQGKRAVFFTAVESDSRRNLALFSQQVMAQRDLRSSVVFSSWEAAFDEINDLAAQPLILVIDEFPYLAQAERSISSILQQYCDIAFSKRPIMIILCGSSMSFMEHQVLGYQSPLYGRRTAQMKIEPLGYEEAGAFVPSYSREEKALVFGITGGIPKYLELFSDEIPLRDNIIRHFLTPSGYLYEEPANLLKQELREPAKYNLIIEAVAKGATRLNDIATKTGLDSGAASNYISSLLALGIMRKESAITEEKNKRKTLYRLADTMFVFWYRYVFGAEFPILTGDAASLYDNGIEPDMNHFMGPVFETICAEYLGKMNTEGRLPFKIRRLGRWWGSNPVTKTEEEIDLIGLNDKESQALFCECKFRNQAADFRILGDLQKKAENWKSFAQKFFMLFSKSGFTGEARDAARQHGRWTLAGLEEIYG